MGDLVFLEFPDKLVQKVSQVKVLPPLGLKVSLALKDILVHLDLKVTEEYRETKGYQVSVDRKVTMVSLELDYQAHPALKASLESQELQDSQENQEDQDRMV